MENNNSKKEITLEDLAGMMQKGFLSMDEKMDEKLNKLEEKLTLKIEGVVEGAKDELKAELNKKVDIFTHKDLEFRVEKLEEKTGIAKLKTAIV